MIDMYLRPACRDALLRGCKTVITKLEQHGCPGDQFEAFGARFVITHVLRSKLAHVINDCWRQEGFETIAEMLEFWTQASWLGKFNGDVLVWVHIVQRITNVPEQSQTGQDQQCAMTLKQ